MAQPAAGLLDTHRSSGVAVALEFTSTISGFREPRMQRKPQQNAEDPST